MEFTSTHGGQTGDREENARYSILFCKGKSFLCNLAWESWKSFMDSMRMPVFHYLFNTFNTLRKNHAWAKRNEALDAIYFEHIFAGMAHNHLV